MAFLDKAGLAYFWSKIAAKLNEKVNKTDVVQSDWNENDETSMAYVQNRTHYAEFDISRVLFEDTVEGVANSSSASLGYSLPYTINGADLIVTLNGIEYECTCVQQGPKYVIQINDTYSITCSIVESVAILNGLTAGESYSVKIEKIEQVVSNVKTLDDIYIPSTIARASDLIQSDWNISDETNLAYIQNRPFYEETDIVELLPETTVTTTSSIEKIADFNIEIVAGQNYTVTHNGTVYELTLFGNWLGDKGPFYTDDISHGYAYPFFIRQGDGVYVYGTGDHTIKVEGPGTTIKKIDEKFLPESTFLVTINNGRVDKTSEEIQAALVDPTKTVIAYSTLLDQYSSIVAYYSSSTIQEAHVFWFIQTAAHNNYSTTIKYCLCADNTAQYFDIEIPQLDTTLAIEGKAADAKAVGDEISALNTLVGEVPVADQISEAIENSEKLFVVSVTYSSSSTSGFIANVGKTEILNAINNGLFPIFTLQDSGVLYHYWGQDSNGNPIFKAPTMVEEDGVTIIRSLTVTVYEDKTVTFSNPLEIEKYILPTASSSTLGGVKPVTKTNAMTQEIGVDASGKLYTTPTDLTALNTLIGDDTGKSAREIAEDELIKQLVPETAQESLDTLTEIAAWIQEHPEDAAAMNEDITELQGLVGTTSVQEQINAAIEDSVAQADWNENDETSPAYIQNRPFYTTDLETLVLRDGTYTFVDGSSVSENYAGMFINVEDSMVEYKIPREGQQITFVFDGTDYSGPARKTSGSLGELIYFGNASLAEPFYGRYYDLPDTGESYAILLLGGTTAFLFADSGTEHTVFCSLEQQDIIQIPEEYIPLNIWNGEGVYSIIVNTPANSATGAYSYAEGDLTTASGGDSHAEGLMTTASGQESHAEGNLSKAEGKSSHAEGWLTTASAGDAHSEGMLTIASGENSHAEGYWTLASGWNSHVQGKANIEDTENKYAHIVGNGDLHANTINTITGELSGISGTRSNAHTLDWDGNAWFAGTIKVGGIGQDDAAAVEVALKSDLPTKSNSVMAMAGNNTCSSSASEIAQMINEPLPLFLMLYTTDGIFKVLPFCGTLPPESSEILEPIPFSCTEIDENGNTVTTVVKVYEDKHITVETSTCAPDFVVTATPLSTTLIEDTSIEVSSSHTYAEIMEQIAAGRQVVARMEGIGDLALSSYHNNGITFTAYTAYFDRVEESLISIRPDGTASLIIFKYYYNTVATSTTLGSVMPVAKTDTMTQAVGIDAEGRLYTEGITEISDADIDAICGSTIVSGQEVSL